MSAISAQIKALATEVKALSSSQDIFDQEHHMTRWKFSLSHRETERFLCLMVRQSVFFVSPWDRMVDQLIYDNSNGDEYHTC